MQDIAAPVEPSTLHSFAISVLLSNPGCAPLHEPLRIADDWEARALVRPHLGRLVHVAPSRGSTSVFALIAEMAAKWARINPDFEAPAIPSELRYRFLAALNVHRRVFGYTLLAELPELLRTALRTYPELRGTEFDLLVVDEYQDLNACDLEVLRLLNARGARVVAIGDDDQSIYSFRHAAPEGIRNFPNEYADVKPYTLTICHRLNAKLGEWAQSVIAGETNRAPRPPLTYGDDAPVGLMGLVSFKTEKSEAKGVAQVVRWLKDKGVPLGEILILFRTDDQSRFSKPVREQLERLGIDTVDAKRSEKLLAEPSGRRLLAVLQLLANPKDSLAWWTLLEFRARVGASAVDYLYDLAQSQGATFGDALASQAPGFVDAPGRLASQLSQLWADTVAALDLAAPGLPTETNAWGGCIVGLVANGRLPECSEELLNLLNALDDPTEEPVPFAEFVGRLGLRLREQAEIDQDGVRLMTMQTSKGLTVQACIVVGVDDELLSRPGADVREELRLLYVAMTRAKEHLVLTWAQKRQGPGGRSSVPNSGMRHESGFVRSGPVPSETADEFFVRLASH